MVATASDRLDELFLDRKVNVVHFMGMVHGIEPSRVERKREARAVAILDEAMVILAREGLEGLTLGRLAKSLDLVPAALYRYFPSKDALLAALQRRAVATIHDGLTGALAALEGRPVLERLLGAARFYLALPQDAPQSYFLVALLLGDPRPLLSDEESLRTAPLLLGLLADVEALFQEAERDGAVARGDSLERTLAFWALVQGALSLEKMRRIAPSMPTPSEVADAGLTALLVGWGATPAQIKLPPSGIKKRVTRHVERRS